MSQNYSDPYGQGRPNVQHTYSDSTTSQADQYTEQTRPYSQANYPLPKQSTDRFSSYEEKPENSFARPRKANPDGTTRTSRFVGMAANGERPASQWTQGKYEVMSNRRGKDAD
jgi:hypothetical protein